MYQNKVELIGYYGSDIVHAQSAWTSTSRDLTEEKLGRVDKLLKMLAKEGHHTPFEKSCIHFLVTVDQASHIHTLKHRISVAVNGECLTGDSLITFIKPGNALEKIPISVLYEKWNSGRPHQNTERDKEYTRKRIKGKRIRVLNEETGVFEKGHIADVMQSGFKEVYLITTECGKTIKCSKNHKIFTSEGWKTIENGLSTKDFVGLNGILVAGTGEYRNKDVVKMCREKNMSVQEMADLFKCSYHTVRKWLKIHGLTFSKEEHSYNMGHIPWNKGKNGYKLTYTEKGWENKLAASAKQPKGEKSKFWRGGITNERGLIGQFTRSVARDIHKKYNYTCQNCGLGNNLHCHHIVPVVTDISKAYDLDNLITVCKSCHNEIHRSAENEVEFANKVTGKDFTPMIKEFGKNSKNRVSRKLKVHFSKIKSIEAVGVEMCYDLEVDYKFHNFIANGMVVHNSARYKELKEDKFYMPEDWIGIKNSSEDEDWYTTLLKFTEMANKLYHKSLEELTPVLGRKRAKESARFFKTMNSQITLDVMFNWRSFNHFLTLRNNDHAQKEINEISSKMLEIAKGIEGNPFKHTIEAFGW